MQRFKSCISRCFLFLFLFLSFVVYADDVTFGSVSGDIVEGPLTGLRHVISGICYLVGFMFLVVSIKKYIGWRMAPNQLGLSTPLMYFLLGTALILLPLVYYVSGATLVLG
ncbi:MAG: hypothetical protein KKH06_03435 [Gammaproteobacteria bacterium]|nr:hypothetical protein [Gammaproteobacteria bacterium]MBU1926289.1 hypothetical protein [Gammaproteobacteria bacterium]